MRGFLGCYFLAKNLDQLFQETERLKLHELLETETITASVLRYKLQYFPSDIKNEIQGTLLMSIIYFYFLLVLIHAIFWEPSEKQNILELWQPYGRPSRRINYAVK